MIYPPKCSLVVAVGSVLILTAGCGDRLPVAPVSGRITFEGAPLVGATVTTQPIAVEGNDPGSGSFGKTDEEGRYELELVTPEMKGAIIGAHRVMITPSDGTVQPDAEAEQEVYSDDPNAHRQGIDPGWPVRFSDGSLQLEVPAGGRDDANFDLTRSS